MECMAAVNGRLHSGQLWLMAAHAVMQPKQNLILIR